MTANPAERRPGPGKGRVALVCALALSLAAPVLIRADGGSSLDLRQAVPSDVGLYFHAHMPDDRASVPALAAMGRVLSSAGFMAPFVAYLDEVVLARKRRALDPELEYWRSVLEKNPWWKLFHREFFLAGRLEFEHAEMEIYRRAWLMGFRVAPEERDLLLQAMSELFEAFAAIVPGSELDEGRRDGSRVTCLYSLFDRSRELCVTGRDGLILASTSRSLLRHSMQLLAGESSDIPFALSRIAGAGAADAASPERRSFAWLSSQSRYLSAHTVPAAEGSESVAGFELMVRPLALFKDLLSDDPLLSDWKSLNVAGDFRVDGLHCFFDTDLQAGREELGRVLYRALMEPVERPSLGPILYRELGALLPRDDDELEPPEVTVILRELAAWLKNGLDVLDPSGRRAASETVTDPGGTRRLRGEASLPLRVRESAGR